MTDFLLELRSEEIPARMQDKARDDLARLFAAEVAKAGLTAGETVTYATPRRLVLIARDLPDATQAVSTEVKGPRAAAPPQALEGFLRKTGLTRDQLTERDGVLFAVTEAPGRATADVLADAIPAIFRAFPWPKSMRWGDLSVSPESPRWVRPLQGVVAMLGADVVPCTVAGVPSDATTLGHRFHHPGPITLGGAADYVEKLRACHVIVDQDERRTIVREGAERLATAAGLALVEDEGLVAENAGLTEWPVPLLGRFDPDFLSVPPEVIQLTARVNQKYFVCRVPPRAPLGEGDHAQHGGGAAGALADAFICVANIDAADGGTKIADGNRKVLAARLSDARFFYETDLKVPLEDQAKKLDRIVFHEKLGTVTDKVDRVAKLARWLVEEGIVSPAYPGEGPGPATPASASAAPSPETSSDLDPGLRRGGTMGREELADLAERAARLCKADLVTGMVGEFPELQGVMGGYYAAAQGEHPAVAEAIRDHYKPVGQGDDVPTAPVTVAVSLADKLDTLATFFVISERPSGSRDPFALRRSELAVVRLIVSNHLRLRWSLVHQEAANNTYESILAARLKRLGDKFEGLECYRYPDRPEQDEADGLSAEDVFDWAYEADRVSQAIRNAPGALAEFLIDRLKVQQREAGVRHDLIDAVFALGGEDDLVRLLARVRALQAFVGTDDGANLLTGYRRAANILKKEGYEPSPSTCHPGLEPGSRSSSPPDSGAPDQVRGDGGGLSYTPEPAEADLIAALDAAEPAAARAVEQERFEAAMTALASLRAPIDRFFDDVTVNDPVSEKRAARLALLARVRDAVHRVADFSRIES